jgi:hypothetical protein
LVQGGGMTISNARKLRCWIVARDSPTMINASLALSAYVVTEDVVIKTRFNFGPIDIARSKK